MRNQGKIVWWLLVGMVLAYPAMASQVNFETYGDVNISYMSPNPSKGGSAENGFDQDSDTAIATANVDGLEGVNGFSMAQTNGLNNVGASSGVSINRHPFYAPPSNPAEDPKYNVSAWTHATAGATNKYYFSGGEPGWLTPISMGFSYDGLLTGVMGNLDIGAMGEAGGHISYSVSASVWSDGYWSPEGIGWNWSFTDRDQFDLTATRDFSGEINGYVWQNEDGVLLGDQMFIGDDREMHLNVFGAEYLKNAVFFASYTIAVEVVLDGLAFEEGGYLYTKSDFYNTLGVSILSTDTVSTQEFPTGSNGQVPEPATMVLFGMALLSFAGVSRKKKQHYF